MCKELVHSPEALQRGEFGEGRAEISLDSPMVSCSEVRVPRCWFEDWGVLQAIAHLLDDLVGSEAEFLLSSFMEEEGFQHSIRAQRLRLDDEKALHQHLLPIQESELQI